MGLDLYSQPNLDKNFYKINIFFSFFSSSIEEKTVDHSSGLWVLYQNKQIRLFIFNTRTASQYYHYMLIWVLNIIPHWLILRLYAEYKKGKSIGSKGLDRVSFLHFLVYCTKCLEMKQNFLFYFTQRLPQTVPLFAIGPELKLHVFM